MNLKASNSYGRHLTDRRIIYVLLFVYLLFFLSQTLLLRGTYNQRANLTPFWTIARALRGDVYRFQLLVINILITVPIGYLVSAAAWRLGHSDLRKILMICAFLFIFVEAAQFVTGRGLAEFDDVFHNTLGALIGIICYVGPLAVYDALAVILTGGGMLQVVDIIYYGPTKFLRAARIPMQIWILSSVPTAILTVLIFRRFDLYGPWDWSEKKLRMKYAGKLACANALSVLAGVLLIWLVLFPYHLPWYNYVGCAAGQTLLTYFVRAQDGFFVHPFGGADNRG